jgi:hypothetical protein
MAMPIGKGKKCVFFFSSSAGGKAMPLGNEKMFFSFRGRHGFASARKRKKKRVFFFSRGTYTE